jgi:uncharacterized protein (DUF4415 family)
VTFSRADITTLKKKGKVRATPQDAPSIDPDEAFWAKAEIVPTVRPRKISVHLRLDRDVLTYFKSNGEGHLTRMAHVLKSYVKAKTG